MVKPATVLARHRKGFQPLLAVEESKARPRATLNLRRSSGPNHRDGKDECWMGWRIGISALQAFVWVNFLAADWRFAVKPWAQNDGGTEIAFLGGTLQPCAPGDDAVRPYPAHCDV